MAILAAIALTVAISGGLIGKILGSEDILLGAIVNALAGIGFAILALRDEN